MPRKSVRVVTLVQGLKDLWGDEAVQRLLSNPFTAEEIAREGRRHPVDVLEAALSDARAASARSWAWIAERLRRGPSSAASGSEVHAGRSPR